MKTNLMYKQGATAMALQLKAHLTLTLILTFKQVKPQ